MGSKKGNTEYPILNIEFSRNDGEMKNKSRKYDLEERLIRFAVSIIGIAEALPCTRAGNHIAVRFKAGFFLVEKATEICDERREGFARRD